MISHYLRRENDAPSKTWLIQRLDKPFKSRGPMGADNPFAFGGGYKNGGLSDEAMGLLRDIFSFDYMGAAEFEFGAVPDALNAIANDAHKGDLVAHTFEFDKSQMEKDWRKEATQPEGTATIYVLCHKDWVDEVEKRIIGWAKPLYNSELKETTHLSEVLHSTSDSWKPRTGGWLELNNGYMFFTDKEMFDKTASLFGVRQKV